VGKNHPRQSISIVGVLLIPLLANCSPAPHTATWVSGWREAVPMTTPRTGAKAVAVHDRIYVMGGGEGIPGPNTVHRSVEYCRIRTDGRLEAWKAASPMNTPRIFLAAARSGEVIYALGGEYFPEGQMRLLNSVEYARVGADGELGPWHATSPMRTPRRSPTAAVVGEYLYAMGGYNGVFLRTVERAKILKEGDLGPWEWVPQQLTTSRYIHGGAAVGNRIYVVGGHLMESGGGSSAAEWATVDSDGQINSWKTTSALLQPRFLAGSGGTKEYIFIVGGYDGDYMNSVEEAHILPDGSLAPWARTSPLPTPREGAAVAVYGEKLYVIGGSNHGVFLRTAEWAEIGRDGQLGYWKRGE
jgi:Kelch motif